MSPVPGVPGTRDFRVLGQHADSGSFNDDLLPNMSDTLLISRQALAPFAKPPLNSLR